MSSHIAIESNGNEPTIYVEGLSQLMLGFPMSRITLYDRATPGALSPSGNETQRQRCELVIPTAALLEMCQTVLSHAAGVSDDLKGGSTEWLGRVHGVLNTLADVKFGAALATKPEAKPQG